MRRGVGREHAATRSAWLISGLLADSDNWVIYLQKTKPGEKALARNYAKGGETTEGVIDQVDVSTAPSLVSFYNVLHAQEPQTFLNDDPPAGVDLANTDNTLVCKCRSCSSHPVLNSLRTQAYGSASTTSALREWILKRPLRS